MIVRARVDTRRRRPLIVPAADFVELKERLALLLGVRLPDGTADPPAESPSPTE